MSFLWGFIITFVGALIVIYADGILSFFGRMDWAEKWLLTYGGSRLGYKLIGLFAIVVGMLMMTGLLGGIVISLFGGLFRGFAE